MELNSDVLRIIAGLSDDTVTLVSKTMRDGYFDKNGIWIKLGIELEEKVSFPLKFYNYPVNINILPESSGHWVNLSKTIQKSLSRIYSDELDMLIEHIYKNTRYARNLYINNSDLFSGPIKLHKVSEYMSEKIIDMLKSGKISNSVLIPNGDFYGRLGSMLESIKDIDYNIKLVHSLNFFRKDAIEYIVDKLKFISNTSFRAAKIYPCVRHIHLDNQSDINDILNCFDIHNFPKLRKVSIPNHIFDLVSERLKDTSIKIRVGGILTTEQYRNISRDGINTELSFSISDEEPDLGLSIENSIEMEKYGTGYMSVRCYTCKRGDICIDIQIMNILEIIHCYKDFHLTFCIECLGMSDILMAILSDDKLYNGQIVRFKGSYILKSKNVARLANQIWEEKKLYIDMDYIGYAPYVDIEKYRKYRPLFQ